jgi:hypothetical protein
MEALYRFFSSIVVSIFSLFAPIHSVIFCALGFDVVDIITGVAASRAVALREGRRW